MKRANIEVLDNGFVVEIDYDKQRVAFGKWEQVIEFLSKLEVK